MKHLENAIRFLLQNWLLAVPLFVLTAIPTLITGTGNSLGKLTNLWSYASNPSQISNFGTFFTLTGTVLALVVGGSILTFVFQFVSTPATYGLVNKKLDTGNASLNDLGLAISTNFTKYVMYFVGNLIVWLVFTLVSAIVLGIFIAIRLYIIFGLLLLVLFIAAAVIGVLLSFWYAAMVVDGLDVFAAAKKSIEIAKTCFWTVIGIAILVAIAGGILSGILGLLSAIPLLGPIIASIAPTLTSFVMTVFFLLVYRERTGKIGSDTIA